MKDPVIKGMEGIKSDRPLWINKIQKQFADDLKNGKYKIMESGKVPPEELEIKLTLAKDPGEYPENRMQRLVGSELDARQGDTIKYYKSELTGGGTSNPNLNKQTEIFGNAENDI